MRRRDLLFALAASAATGTCRPDGAMAQWVTRDHRWPPRGPWSQALPRELPQLFREFNGIDFGHAHLAETLLETQDPARVEQARLEILDFIFSEPPVPPDEEQVAPTFVRLAWEVQRAFNWAHTLHRSLYDLFASRHEDQAGAYRRLLAGYLDKPEAITPATLDHHGRLWGFPESKAFRDRFPTFNTQIWAYHWLQAAVYDVQLLGDAGRQRALMPKVITHYHGYLRRPPVVWQFMPLMAESAPRFTERFPEAANIFDNLHMLHDNVDDVLCRPDLFPTLRARRERLLGILPIYLHRSGDRYAEYRVTVAGPGGHGGHAGHGAMAMGPRPPSAHDVLDGRVAPGDPARPSADPPAGTPAPDRAPHRH